MNGSKRARRSASITNRTDVYGIMPGIVNGGTRSASTRPAYVRAPGTANPSTTEYSFFPRPTKPEFNKPKNAYAYLVHNMLLSKNPTSNAFKRQPRPANSLRGGKNYNNPLVTLK